MVVCTLAALAVSIIYYRRHRRLRIFTWYIAFSFLQDMAVFFAFLSSPTSRPPMASLPMSIMVVSRHVFMVFEFVIYNLFILYYIKSHKWRRVIWMNGFIFFVVLLLTVARFYNYLNTHPIYYPLLESIFLVPPCLIYFYQLFTTIDPGSLKDQPPFWVITGMLFLKACSIPLYLTVQLMVGYENAVYTLNYVLYIVMFVLLIRAYFCPALKIRDIKAGDPPGDFLASEG